MQCSQQNQSRWLELQYSWFCYLTILGWLTTFTDIQAEASKFKAVICYIPSALSARKKSNGLLHYVFTCSLQQQNLVRKSTAFSYLIHHNNNDFNSWRKSDGLEYKFTHGSWYDLKATVGWKFFDCHYNTFLPMEVIVRHFMYTSRFLYQAGGGGGGHWPRKGEGVWGCVALKSPFSRLSCSLQRSHFKQNSSQNPLLRKFGNFNL